MNDEDFQRYLNATPPVLLTIRSLLGEVLIEVTLDTTGFSKGKLKKQHFPSYLWKNISPMVARRTLASPFFKVLCFDDGRRGILPALVRFFNGGYNDAITSRFTPYIQSDIEQMAQIMNHWRDNALKENG